MPREGAAVGLDGRSRTEAWYAVHGHESTHWAGAAHRPNREFGKRFGDDAYCFEEACAEIGAAFPCARLGIDRVMTDNGSCYKSFALARACKRLRIKHIRTKPYTPQTNGKAERFIQTALCEWAYATAFEHSDHRRAELPAWLHRYNWHRPHTSLANRRGAWPASQCEEWIARPTSPYLFRVPFWQGLRGSPLPDARRICDCSMRGWPRRGRETEDRSRRAWRCTN